MAAKATSGGVSVAPRVIAAMAGLPYDVSEKVLAEAAGVTPRTIRRYRAAFQAAGLVPPHVQAPLAAQPPEPDAVARRQDLADRADEIHQRLLDASTGLLSDAIVYLGKANLTPEQLADRRRRGLSTPGVATVSSDAGCRLLERLTVEAVRARTQERLQRQAQEHAALMQAQRFEEAAQRARGEDSEAPHGIIRLIETGLAGDDPPD